MVTVGIDASRAELAKKTGVERYSYEIIRALRGSLPDDVRVVLYSRVPLPAELGPFDERWQNRVLRWPPIYLWTQLRLSWEMWRRPTDVLFVPSAALPRILPAQTVTTLHDATFVEYPQLYSMWQRLTLPLGLWDTRRATTVIVPSEFTASQVRSRFKVEVQVIALGATVPIVVPASSDAPYFIVIGRVSAKKNLPVAIEAFEHFAEKHPEYHLKFVGKFDFGSEKIVERAQRSPAVNRIEFLGALPDEEMYPLLAGAMALVHPCPVEGFGLPVIEAMALGVPVIVSDGGAARESAGDAALVVRATEVDEWAGAMDQSLYEMARGPLVNKGRTQAARFSWARAAEETWKMLIK